MQCAALGWLGTCLLAASPFPSTPQTEKKLDRYEFLQIQMGVPFKIVLYAPDEAAANNAVRAAYRRIKQLNTILSDYDPDSELMRLCRSSGPGKPVKVSPELLFVLSRSLALSRKTDGAFDVTVGPVVKLWRIARRRKKLPPPKALAEARRLVGFRHVRLDRKAGTVELLKPGIRLDLGGIAKGYAGDEALAVLKTYGISRALIDGSGDIIVGEPPPGKRGWRIAIARPLFVPPSKGAKQGESEGTPSRSFLLSNAAVATSGDAYQFIEIDGKRYSHIVDPKTGLGLTRRSSATVIAPDGITADSLASAVSVLGPQRGLQIIEQTRGTATLIVRLIEGSPTTFTSRQFATSSRP